MAINPIRAVVFDMGGTLEELYYDDAVRLEATCGLRELLRSRGLDPGLSVPNLMAAVLGGMRTYQAWREQTEMELPPERVWTEYVFPDNGLPCGQLAAAAEEIAFFYETHYYVRSMRTEASAVVEALHKQGFRLAVISNIVSRRMVPCKLVEYGLADYFDPVVTSSEFGWRKPNARIFEEAARLMRLPTASCAYVGDTIARDVIGARRAGYGLAIQIRSFLTDKVDHEPGVAPGDDGMPLDDRGPGDSRAPGDSRGPEPDAVVADLMQVIPVVNSGLERRRGH